MVNESRLEISGLELNRKYYWRVWPFNESVTDAGWAATETFITGVSTAVTDIDGIEQFALESTNSRLQTHSRSDADVRA